MKATHDLRDPSADQIHLVHIGSQHVEVQGEGGLRYGAGTTWTERSPKHSGTRVVMHMSSAEAKALGTENGEALSQTILSSFPHQPGAQVSVLPPNDHSQKGPFMAQAKAQLPGGHHLLVTVW